MRKAWIFLIVAVVVAIFAYGLSLKILDREYGVTSPLPSFLSIIENSEVSTLDIWTPVIGALFTSSGVPEISAKSALIYDTTTKKTLYSKNALERLPMASLTKIMTAVVALENSKKDNYIVKERDLVGEDSMGLSRGEVMSLNELLYGLMLYSGNDAAETIASNYTKGREGFIKAMNDKANSLGLKDTHFTNPTGLEGDGNQYTTVHDLLVITDYAMRFEQFAKVVETFQHHIPYTLDHKEFFLENTTNLLTSYPGIKGVKIGYTPEAGECLVTYLDYKGHKIIGIILGSDNRRQEMKDLLDFALESEGVPPPPHG